LKLILDDLRPDRADQIIGKWIDIIDSRGEKQQYCQQSEKDMQQHRPKKFENVQHTMQLHFRSGLIDRWCIHSGSRNGHS